MHSVTVCRSCGRTINKEYVYCPWCGISALTGNQYSDTIDDACERLEEVQARGRDERIHRLEDSLDQLEKELEVLISRGGAS